MAKLNPQRRIELETEREFLLHSLSDLETERDEGGIDTATFETLHSDYTARAAIVLRALAGGDDERPKAPPIPKSKRMLALAAVILFAGIGAFSLTKAVGTRAPGGPLTGNSANTYEGHMDTAARFADARDPKHALQEYQKAQALDPTRAEVHVEIAKLLISQIKAGDSSPKLLDAADAALNRALQLDAKYAPAYAFKGVVTASLRHDSLKGVPFLLEYLRLAPHGAYTNMAQRVVSDAANAATTTTGAPGGATTTAPGATTTTTVGK